MCWKQHVTKRHQNFLQQEDQMPSLLFYSSSHSGAFGPQAPGWCSSLPFLSLLNVALISSPISVPHFPYLNKRPAWAPSWWGLRREAWASKLRWPGDKVPRKCNPFLLVSLLPQQIENVPPLRLFRQGFNVPTMRGSEAGAGLHRLPSTNVWHVAFRCLLISILSLLKRCSHSAGLSFSRRPQFFPFRKIRESGFGQARYLFLSQRLFQADTQILKFYF